MKHRKLRIAWSVGWGVACLLLIALWVRSYCRYDLFFMTVFNWRTVGGTSDAGMLALRADESRLQDFGGNWFAAHSIPQPTVGSIEKDPVRSFALYTYPLTFGVILHLPHWSLALFLATIAAAPWLRWRYSLRTLLIVTTLIAVGLGLIVYVARK